MRLEKLWLKGFRLFNQPVEIEFDQLTMLIGNNDSGKSSILDILEIALTSNGRPDENDFYSFPGGGNGETIELILYFKIDPEEQDGLDFSIERSVTFRATYTRDNTTKEYLAILPVHNDLRVNFSRLNASDQRAIIEKYDPAALDSTSNSENRTEWFNHFIETVEKEEDWVEAPADLQKVLPRFQRYGAMDYETPENLINKTVKQVFETVLYEELSEEEDGERSLKSSLREIELEAEKEINEKVSELKGYILRYAPTVHNISYLPHIDFARGFQSGDFKVDEGKGEHFLNKSGDGTKRKIFMAITDWDRDVTLSIQAEGGSLPAIIRGYDEPDTNLDYLAQRQLYKSISEISASQNSHIQSIICTHSPRMIDRAPAKSIRMLTDCEGEPVIEKLETCDDKAVEAFLSDVARDLGITNSLMFYENCFIFVEGETEDNALPLFYRTIYGHSMLEDGINIINVRGKSAFKEFLRLISQNRQALAVFLMDRDCCDTEDDKLTDQVLLESGFSEEFCQERRILVGKQEFEDLFEVGVYSRIYNKKWPKPGGDWNEDDFLDINPEKKFSSELGRICFHNCGTCGDKWSKPDLGYALGKECLEEEIPQEIKDLFALARSIAKVI